MKLIEEMFEEDAATVTLAPLQAGDVGVIVRVMLTFDRAATDFLGDCERRGFTPTSLVTYQRTYDEFADFIPRDTDVSKITADDIRRYLNTKSRLAPGTRAGIEAHLASLFGWLLREGKIVRDPIATIARTRRLPAEDLDVVTVTTDEVQKMLAVAQGWSERLCMGVLVFTGCRRRAASRLRISDYDRINRKLRFREKGAKTITKPVPDELATLIDAAISAGVYETGDDYLIPNLGPRPHGIRKERSHRVVYDIVKQVAARAGVRAHTHAMRAAFAVYYLETHQRDTLALQSLLGHKSPATTQIYLRKLDRVAEMERVRDLSWGVAVGQEIQEVGTAEGGGDQARRRVAAGCGQVAEAAEAETDSGLISGGRIVVGSSDNAPASTSPQIAGSRFDEDAVVGAGGFEPPYAEDPLPDRAHTKHLDVELQEAANQAASEPHENLAEEEKV